MTDPQEFDLHVTAQNPNWSRILVYRLGSIGDFVVSLPCFHLLRRRFPSSTIGLLTNKPVEGRAAPAADIIGGAGLIDWHIDYAVGARSYAEITGLRQNIREQKPQLLVYLAAPRGLRTFCRDYLFFRWCGIPRIVGIPFERNLRQCQPRLTGGGLVEMEAERLGRCIASLGSINADRPENWDLDLTTGEIDQADRALGFEPVASRGPMECLGLAIGTKQPVKDWGDQKWRAVLDGICGSRAMGLVLIGAAEEAARAEAVARGWPGPVINLCGRLSPRLSAAALRRVRLLLCHDSGPMHLAAAVGTPCVAVFSKKDAPGRWFPFGPNHRILYPSAGTASIDAITPAEVIAASLEALGAARNSAPRP